jgi:hypothetical protein
MDESELIKQPDITELLNDEKRIQLRAILEQIGMTVTSMQGAEKVKAKLASLAEKITGIFSQGSCPKPFNVIARGLKEPFVFQTTMLTEAEQIKKADFTAALEDAQDIL